jgi:multisubunit Na+/H+ antiporter MnhB subunit
VLFVESGFGWGWENRTPGIEYQILVVVGISFGLIFAAFSWIVSRNFFGELTVALVLINVLLAIAPAEVDMLRIALFVLANSTILSLWARWESSKKMVASEANSAA